MIVGTAWDGVALVAGLKKCMCNAQYLLGKMRLYIHKSRNKCMCVTRQRRHQKIEGDNKPEKYENPSTCQILLKVKKDKNPAKNKLFFLHVVVFLLIFHIQTRILMKIHTNILHFFYFLDKNMFLKTTTMCPCSKVTIRINQKSYMKYG